MWVAEMTYFMAGITLHLTFVYIHSQKHTQISLLLITTATSCITPVQLAQVSAPWKIALPIKMLSLFHVLCAPSDVKF